MQRTSLLLLLALGLAACDRAAPAPDAANAAAPATAAAANAMAAPPRAGQEAVTLEGEGLRLAQGSLPFGAPQAQAIQSVTQALGAPPGEQGVNEECGQGPVAYATWPGQLSLSFQEGHFVGWDSRGSLADANGIRIGSTRAELDAASDPDITESSLGTEFALGNVGGVLESPAPTARITNLWAGSVCIFR